MVTANSFDVLIIGSGAAGLSLALRLPSHVRVAILAKSRLEEGCTLYAQGGISAVTHASDSFESHIADTLDAGANLNNPETVRFAIENAPEAIQWLVDMGVPFTRNNNDFHLTREGGHSTRRVLHAADATGRVMETTLLEEAHKRSNISLMEHYIAIDLVTGSKLGLAHNRCLGAYVLNRSDQSILACSARNVVLATGGASKVYLYTSNPDTLSGDGIAMAWRAGCRVANMEFNQFHPTCLYHPKAKSFLVTEAVRGEGGRLLLPDGSSFMERFDDRGNLAPRDIVARAIDHEMKRLGAEYVLLDISHKSAPFIKEHFPTIYARCRELGYDMTLEPIPVVPAAHYTCGGVMTDLHGQTDIAGLYAIGEVACTGMHGANRMASNSLLECLVFARAASEHITATLADTPDPAALPPWDESRVRDSDEEVVVSHNWDELRRCMWNYVGIVRTDKRLQRAWSRVDLLQQEIQEYYSNFTVSNDLLELRNLAQVAALIIRSAQQRKESRGLHFTLDYPDTDNSKPPADTILTPETPQPVELAVPPALQTKGRSG
jgi:L-aspartate oxidase